MRLLTFFTHQSLFRFCLPTMLTLVMSLPLVSFAQSSASAHSSPASGMHHSNMGMTHMDHHSMKMTGDTDYDFAMMMRMHHEHGLKLAQNEIDNGKDATLRTLAKKIVATHKKEIAEFDRWMAENPPKAR